MKKLNIVITGKVQGVGFRYWLYQIANEKNVYGFATIGDTKNFNEAYEIWFGTQVKGVLNLNDVRAMFAKKFFNNDADPESRLSVARLMTFFTKLEYSKLF